MKIIGFITLAIGSLIALASFGYDTAPEGTHNIGLMQQQMMLFGSGGLIALAGVIVSSLSMCLHRLEQAGILPPAGHSAIPSDRSSNKGGFGHGD